MEREKREKQTEVAGYARAVGEVERQLAKLEAAKRHVEVAPNGGLFDCGTFGNHRVRVRRAHVLASLDEEIREVEAKLHDALDALRTSLGEHHG